MVVFFLVFFVIGVLCVGGRRVAWRVCDSLVGRSFGVFESWFCGSVYEVRV